MASLAFQKFLCLLEAKAPLLPPKVCPTEKCPRAIEPMSLALATS